MSMHACFVHVRSCGLHKEVRYLMPVTNCVIGIRNHRGPSTPGPETRAARAPGHGTARSQWWRRSKPGTKGGRPKRVTERGIGKVLVLCLLRESIPHLIFVTVPPPCSTLHVHNNNASDPSLRTALQEQEQHHQPKNHGFRITKKLPQHIDFDLDDSKPLSISLALADSIPISHLSKDGIAITSSSSRSRHRRAQPDNVRLPLTHPPPLPLPSLVSASHRSLAQNEGGAKTRNHRRKMYQRDKRELTAAVKQ